MSRARFTLRQLQYFIAAGEVGSIAKAAQQISISQPSISAAISQLEQSLGVQLFVRHHAQGLSLTPAGRRILREAKVLVDQAQELSAMAGALATKVAGRLDVGCFITLAPIIVPELRRGFTERFPEVQLTVVEGDQLFLLDGLAEGRIPVALTYDLDLPEQVEFERLARLPPYVLLAAGHPLAARASLSLTDLEEEPLVLLDLPLSRQYFQSMYLRQGLKPRIAAASAYPEVVRSHVAHGIGYSIANVRPRNKASLDGMPLVYVPLEGDHPAMTMGLAVPKGVRPTRTVEAFIEHCRALVSDEAVPGMAV